MAQLLYARPQPFLILLHVAHHAWQVTMLYVGCNYDESVRTGGVRSDRVDCEALHSLVPLRHGAVIAPDQHSIRVPILNFHHVCDRGEHHTVLSAGWIRLGEGRPLMREKDDFAPA